MAQWSVPNDWDTCVEYGNSLNPGTSMPTENVLMANGENFAASAVMTLESSSAAELRA